MAIRKSASSDIRFLIDDLCGADTVGRDTAAARLSVIGARAVPQLLAALRTSASAVARTAILKVLEASADRRGLDTAVGLLQSPGADPKVAAAAVGLIGTFLDSADSGRALDTLTRVVFDAAYGDALRLRAFDALERLSPGLLAPVRARLAMDPSAALRERAAVTDRESPPVADPLPLIESAAAGGAADPVALREAVVAGAAAAPLSTLHRLIEVSRAREASEPAEADWREWQAVRGAVHRALAARGSRVAIYDLRETLSQVVGPLPDDFVATAAQVGDASCLDAIAEAIARAAASQEAADERWRQMLVDAGRLIVRRERLTRRHGVVQKLLRARPEAEALLHPATPRPGNPQ